jgi:hypothetical protein
MGSIAPPRSVSASPSWSGLPEDVLVHILARLPVPNLLRVRTVCKHWTSVTSSPAFLSLCDSQSPEPYFPVMMLRAPNFYQDCGNDSPGPLFGYDHTTQTWQKLPPLDFLPREAMVPVAAAEGLVCFESASRYVLCNPVTRTCVELPRIAYSCTRLSSVHIVVDRSTVSFRVLLLGKVRQSCASGSVQSVVVYDSSAKVWRFMDAERFVTYGETSVLCGDVFYCGALMRSSGKLCVIGFDIRTETWQGESGAVPPHPDTWSNYQLTQVVECGGDVYMALASGYRGEGLHGVVSSLDILKLEAATTESHLENSSQALKAWRQVTRLCDEWLEDLQKAWFYDYYLNGPVCVGHGSRICISAGPGFIVMYDVESDCWSRLPPCLQLFLWSCA